MHVILFQYFIIWDLLINVSVIVVFSHCSVPEPAEKIVVGINKKSVFSIWQLPLNHHILATFQDKNGQLTTILPLLRRIKHRLLSFLLNQFYCTNTASLYKLISHIKFTTQNLLLLEIQLFAQGVNVRQLIVLIIMCIKGKPFGIKHQEYSLYLQSKEKDKQNESLKVRNCSKSLHSHRHR